MKDIYYSRQDLEEMTSISIYALLEEQGADLFGLWSAPKSVLIRSFEEQIGFKA